MEDQPQPDTPRTALCRTMRQLAARGWAQGTGGNFSLLLSSQPFRLLMAPSGVEKGDVTPDDLIVVNGSGAVVEGSGKASAETALHLAIVERLGAGSVLHSHSVYATILSRHFAAHPAITWEGYEMQKGIAGVTTHDSVLRLPILANNQNMPQVALEVLQLLVQHGNPYGILLAGHGLYAWGKDLFEAKRHLEIFEFLLEVRYHELLLRNGTPL
jgi:methylthioribulose-1-phosphate dehydratase